MQNDLYGLVRRRAPHRFENVFSIIEVDIPRPRDYTVLSSERFRTLVAETNDAVHEEAIKAFEAGERELA